jgi:hypothetical protein
MRSASLSRLPDRRRTRPPGASGFLVPLSLRSVAGTTAVTGAVVAAVLTERGPLTQALAQLEGGRRLPLVLAAICAPVVPATTAAAWRSVLASQGLPLRKREAWRCYGLGSLVNTLLPGRAGDAIRVELFSRRLDHERRRWLACGAAASIGLAQSVVFGTLLTTGSLLGELPHWVALAALIYPLVLWLGKRLAAKLRPGGRLACVATASTLSPSASIRLLCWIGAGAVVRLVVVASSSGHSRSRIRSRARSSRSAGSEPGTCCRSRPASPASLQLR